MTERAAPPFRPWRDPAFRLLWAGAATAMAGAQITLVVLPVLVYQLTGSVSRTALLLTVQAAPYLLFGLPAGAVADRVDRRVLMVACDLCSAAAVASIPLAAALGRLTLPHIYVTAAVTATAFVWRDAASFGAVPAIVGRAGIVPTMSVLTSTWSVLQIAAPAAGGVLVATIGPAQALWCESVGYLVAATSLVLIRRPFGSPPAPAELDRRRRVRAFRADIAEGLAFVRRHRVIWPLTVMGFGLSLTGGAVFGLMVVYGVRGLGLDDDDARLAWLYSAGALGALAALTLLPALIRRVGQPRLDLLVRTGNAALLAGIVVAPSLGWALAAIFFWYGTYQMAITSSIALRQQLTPDHLQGRVNVTARMIAWGGQPFGAAIGGSVAELAGVRGAILCMGIGCTAAAFWGWTCGLRGIRTGDVAVMCASAEGVATTGNVSDAAGACPG